MKTFVLSIVAFFNLVLVNAQVVLNEVYTDPGAGNNEFFELYNTSTSTTPENLDNYTILTYYEEPGDKSGFYVLDLPNQSITARNFYVGASNNPFNVQGKSNLSANFSWNSMASGGALTKWEKSGSIYLQMAVSANLNDLFVRRTGIGAGQNIFVFKNGVLINGLIGGTSSSVVPSFIKSMPNLFVDMTGSSPDFTVNFNAIVNNQLEYVTATTGSDNGYIRLKDGACGNWEKSSSQAQHTPGTSNGSATGTIGVVTIAAYINYGTNPGDPSILNYNVNAGPAEAFPVNVQVYRDIGIIGQLDASDELIDSRMINNAFAGVQQVILPNNTDPVMLVSKSPAGCYDNVMAVSKITIPLPVKLVSFNGTLNNKKVSLQWIVAENEIAYMFEVEKSFDGTNFTTAALVFGTDKPGAENYQYAETMNTEKVFYRLRMTDKSQVVTYSKILMFQSAVVTTDNAIKIMNNPATDRLTFNFELKSNQKVDAKIVDLNGRVQMRQIVNGSQGNNYVNMQLAPAMQNGMYIIEVIAGADRHTAKFVKQ